MSPLKTEAAKYAGPGQLCRVRENRKNPMSQWFAWDVHVKYPHERAGKCVVTLVCSRFDGSGVRP